MLTLFLAVLLSLEQAFACHTPSHAAMGINAREFTIGKRHSHDYSHEQYGSYNTNYSLIRRVAKRILDFWHLIFYQIFPIASFRYRDGLSQGNERSQNAGKGS